MFKQQLTPGTLLLVLLDVFGLLVFCALDRRCQKGLLACSLASEVSRTLPLFAPSLPLLRNPLHCELSTPRPLPLVLQLLLKVLVPFTLPVLVPGAGVGVSSLGTLQVGTLLLQPLTLQLC